MSNLKTKHRYSDDQTYEERVEDIKYVKSYVSSFVSTFSSLIKQFLLILVVLFICQSNKLDDVFSHISILGKFAPSYVLNDNTVTVAQTIDKNIILVCFIIFICYFV